MTIDWIREQCLALPHVTEDVKWRDNRVVSIGEKMFAITILEPGAVWLSFKASPEVFAELSERPGIRPAPYLARAQWLAVEGPDAVDARELLQLLRQAHGLVFSKLTKNASENWRDS